MNNEIIIKFCDKCHNQQYVEVAYVNQKEIYYWQCDICGKIHKQDCETPNQTTKN